MSDPIVREILLRVLDLLLSDEMERVRPRDYVQEELVTLKKLLVDEDDRGRNNPWGSRQ